MMWEWVMNNLERTQPGLTIEPPDGCGCLGGFAFMGESIWEFTDFSRECFGL
jgi:hypothetical protein